MLDTADFAVSEWNQWIRGTYNKIPTFSLQLNPRVRLEKRQGQWQVWINGYEFTHVRNPKLRHGKEFTRLVEWAWNRLQEVSL